MRNIDLTDEEFSFIKRNLLSADPFSHTDHQFQKVETLNKRIDEMKQELLRERKHLAELRMRDALVEKLKEKLGDGK